MEESKDYVILYEGITYLWDEEVQEAIPLKEEFVQGLVEVGAPVFRLVDGKIVQLT